MSDKGQSYERELCKLLSLWVTEGADEDVFWRTAMSGGRATVMGRKGVRVRQAGDICAVSPEGFAFCDRFFVELKSRNPANTNLVGFLFKETGPLVGWWLKTQAQAREHGNREPMLICRVNRVPHFIVTRTPTRCHFLHSISQNCYLSDVDDYLRLTPPPRDKDTVTKPKKSRYLRSFADGGPGLSDKELEALIGDE